MFSIQFNNYSLRFVSQSMFGSSGNMSTATLPIYLKMRHHHVYNLDNFGFTVKIGSYLSYLNLNNCFPVHPID